MFLGENSQTESARSALSSFTCTLCNKSYSRHPEYEAHIGSYDHQHRKRLQDLKQLSRDPNAAERARRAEKKADAEAGLRVLDSAGPPTTSGSSITSAGGGGGGGGGFKKGGFKSSFTTVKGPAAPAAPARKNVLGDDEEDDEEEEDNHNNKGDARSTGHTAPPAATSAGSGHSAREDRADVESDTDDDYGREDTDEAYYDPRKPTECFAGCSGAKAVAMV